MKLWFSTEQAAARAGYSRRQLSRVAVRLGIKPTIICGRHFYTAHQIELLKRER